MKPSLRMTIDQLLRRTSLITIVLAFCLPATAYADFEVTIDGTNSPVIEGETLEVTATIENIHWVGSETQTVTLDVAGSQRDSRTLTLDANETQTVTFSWTTASGDAGDYPATVASKEYAATTSVTVAGPANFSVQIDGTNSPITEGEQLSVHAIISNTGGESGTQTVTLNVAGAQRDSRTLTVDPGTQTKVTFSWSTSTGDDGTYSAVVASDDETTSTSVAVKAQAHFAVQIDGTSSPVTGGQSLDVTTTITNTGDVSDTQTIRLDVGGSQRDSKSVTLNAGENTTTTLSWATGSGDAGNHTAAVASSDETASTSVSVHAPAHFAVQIDGTNSPVTEGGTLDITTTIQNTGDVSETQTVTLDVGGSQRDSKSVTLNAGESTTTTLSWTTASGDAGDYTANLASNDESATTSVSVDGPVPVELTAFSGTAERDAVHLHWSTASETNNAGFRVQRLIETHDSASQQRGPGNWETIGRVDGAGTTDRPHTYRFTDANLPYGADSLTYRLKQMDRDGSVNVTEPIAVGRASVKHVQLENAFPNPVQHRVTVQFAIPENTSPATLRLYDLLGRQIRTLTTTADPGYHERQMDVSTLPPGTYILRLTAGGSSRTKRLTVVQ